MATPTPTAYNVAHGVTALGGRVAALPAWAASALLLTPLLIPNSAGFGGTTGVGDYSGFQVIQPTGEMVAALCGGHSGTSDNRVVGFRLMDDNPTWAVRNQPTPVGQRVQDAPYNQDGKPAARHMYDSLCYIEQLNRFVIAGMSGLLGLGNTNGATDSYDLVTDQWDAQGTWPSVPDGNTGHGYDPTRGHIWTNSGYRFDAITKTWSKPIATLGNIPIRFPMIHDPVRDIMFCLMFGSNWGGSGTTLNASKWNANGTGSQVAVTFNASAAYTQFLADQAAFTGTLLGSAMTYDHVNACYWWYSGLGATAVGHLYKVIPNSGTAWDMELVQITLPATFSSGVNGALKYVKKLKGFVISPDAKNGGMYFVRTS